LQVDGFFLLCECRCVASGMSKCRRRTRRRMVGAERTRMVLSRALSNSPYHFNARTQRGGAANKEDRGWRIEDRRNCLRAYFCARIKNLAQNARFPGIALQGRKGAGIRLNCGIFKPQMDADRRRLNNQFCPHPPSSRRRDWGGCKNNGNPTKSNLIKPNPTKYEQEPGVRRANPPASCSAARGKIQLNPG
jgi:hypothetical protein